MTRSSRILNRVILAMIGAVALASGLLLAVPGAATRFAWPDLADPVVLWTAAGVAAVVAILGIVWIATRGRGGTASALRIDGTDIDVRVVTDILRDALSGCPDILSVDATASVRRRTRLVRVSVQTRTNPDLPRMRESLDAAIASLDAALGTPLPLVVHVTRGVRTAFARRRAAH